MGVSLLLKLCVNQDSVHLFAHILNALQAHAIWHHVCRV